jgi:phenylpyruvate tautomerase PptA (4-oxalocrotonate tautomerase family)
MPYLRVTSLPLSLEQKRDAVEVLTNTIAQALELSGDRRDWCTVQFTPFQPEDVAVGGRLVADGKQPALHLELSAHDLSRSSKRRLADALTRAMCDLFSLAGVERYRVHVLFRDYAARDLAVGGLFLDEMWRKGLAQLFRRLVGRREARVNRLGAPASHVRT